MASFADYGNLNRVVVGVAENYLPHVWGWRKDGAVESNIAEALNLASAVIPKWIREEVIQDLEDYANFFEKNQIEVLRPPKDLHTTPIVNSSYISFGNDFYNMRDLQIVLGEVLLLAAPACPSRIEEARRLKPFLMKAAELADLSVLESPRPQLKNNPVQEFLSDGRDLIPLEHSKGEKLGGDYEMIWHRLVEEEVLFDAANIARFTDQILFLISSTGNRKAFNWVSDVFAGKYQTYWTNVYRSSHIDSTIIPLSDNVVLVNGARVKPSNLPTELANKKILYFEDVAPIPESERKFHKIRKVAAKELESLGFHSNLMEMSSPWAGLNVLVIKENVIAVESRQKALIRFLENEGFEICPIRFRHPYTFLGGLHCTTLDLNRD